MVISQKANIGKILDIIDFRAGCFCKNEGLEWTFTQLIPEKPRLGFHVNLTSSSVK